MSIIQTQPVGQPGGSTVFTRKLYIVPPTATQGVDSVDITTTIAAKWMVSIRNVVTNDTNVFEVMAVHNNAAALHNISNEVGQHIATFVNVDVFGSFMVLEITNNITDNIEVRVQNITMQL